MPCTASRPCILIVRFGCATADASTVSRLRRAPPAKHRLVGEISARLPCVKNRARLRPVNAASLFVALRISVGHTDGKPCIALFYDDDNIRCLPFCTPLVAQLFYLHVYVGTKTNSKTKSAENCTRHDEAHMSETMLAKPKRSTCAHHLK